MISPLHGPITHHFMAEVSRYKFHFLCEQCAYFDSVFETCVHGYPTEPHRSAYFAGCTANKALIFCREFELC